MAVVSFCLCRQLLLSRKKKYKSKKERRPQYLANKEATGPGWESKGSSANKGTSKYPDWMAGKAWEFRKRNEICQEKSSSGPSAQLSFFYWEPKTIQRIRLLKVFSLSPLWFLIAKCHSACIVLSIIKAVFSKVWVALATRKELLHKKHKSIDFWRLFKCCMGINIVPCFKLYTTNKVMSVSVSWWVWKFNT